MYDFIKEKEIEKIILEHMLTAKELEYKCKELIKRVYEQTVSRVLLQAKLHIESNNHLKSLESLYEELSTLKNKYQSYVDQHDLSGIKSAYAQQTIAGVIQAINNSIEEFPEDDENPLVYERMLYISTVILRLKDQMNKLEANNFQEFELPNSIKNDFTRLISNHLLITCRQIQEPINQLITQATIEFNRIEERPEINKYIEVFKQELVLLGNFVHFDLKIGDSNMSEELAEELMTEYIEPLQRIYVEVKHVLEKVDLTLKTDFNLKALDIDDLERIIEGNLFNDLKLKELMEMVELDKNNKIDMVITYVNDELTKISKSEIRKIKKESSKFELLSCVIVENFERQIENLSKIKLEDIENNTERLIAKGVMDTLQLKYNALKEKDSDYHLKKKEDYLSFRESFLSFKDEFERNCEDYLEESINGTNDGFIKSSERFAKLVTRGNDKNVSEDLKYIKDEILFEYGTFEDMIHQSIRTLAASDNEIAKQFSKDVYQLYEDFAYQFKKQDILRLQPKVGDVFNGKIHEVVITDHEKGFNKGEIIRVQNCGFIYRNRILKRASVIVAK